jgi:hypothetical protein
LIVDAEQKGFAETEQSIARVEGSLAALTKGYQVGTYPLDYYMERGQKLQRELDQLRAAYDLAEKSVAKHGSTQKASAALADQAKKGAANLSMTMLETGRIFQDVVQGGIGGGLNNVERLASSLGLGMGAAGAAQALGVALFLLLPTIKDLIHQLGLGQGQAETFAGWMKQLKERIDEFEKMPKLSLVDLAQLNEAKRILDDMKRGQAEAEAAKRKQSKAEHKAGTEGMEALVESDMGLPEITARLIEQQTKKNLAGSESLRKAIADQDAAREKVERGKKSLSFRVQAEGEAELANAQKAEQTTRTKAAQEAEAQVGGQIEQMREGAGPKQAMARKNLTEGLRGIGQGKLAEQIAGITPAVEKQAEYWDKLFGQLHEQTQHAAQVRRTKEAEQKKKQTAANQIFQDALQDRLEAIKQSDDLKEETDKLLAQAKASKLKGEGLYTSIRDGLRQFLKEQLKDLVAPEGAGPLAFERADDFATLAARQARVKAETEERQGAKATDRAAAKKGKQDARTQFDLDAKALEDELKTEDERAKAEAKRIQEFVGKHAKDVFSAAVNTAPAGVSPEKAATTAAAQMMSQFQQIGATQHGARRAAQEIAAQAGFELDAHDIWLEQRRMLGAAPGAGAKPKPKAKPAALASTALDRADPGSQAQARQAIEHQKAADAKRNETAAAERAVVIAAQTAATNARIAAREAALERALAQAKSNNRQAERRLDEAQPTALNNGGPN